MNNIYNIQAFTASTNYEKNDIISYSGAFGTLVVANVYLYCLEAHTSSGTIDSSKWGGIVVFNGKIKPHFFWEPNYDNTASPQPKVRKITFGDGYELRMEDGINALLIQYNLAFKNRSESEVTAITHFLTQQKAVTSFVFKGRPPFYTNKLYVCEEFSVDESFKNNFTLNGSFREVTT